MYLQNVYDLYKKCMICTQNVYNLYTKCIRSVYEMYTICTQNVHGQDILHKVNSRGKGCHSTSYCPRQPPWG